MLSLGGPRARLARRASCEPRGNRRQELREPVQGWRPPRPSSLAQARPRAPAQLGSRRAFARGARRSCDVTGPGRPHWSISIVARCLNCTNSRRPARCSLAATGLRAPPARSAYSARRPPGSRAEPGSGGRSARSAADRSPPEPRCRAARDRRLARRARHCSRCSRKTRRMSTPRRWRQPSSRGHR